MTLVQMVQPSSTRPSQSLSAPSQVSVAQPPPPSPAAPPLPAPEPEEWVRPYRAMGLDDTTARVYAMCENVDRNVGRVMAKLAELGLEAEMIAPVNTTIEPSVDPA